MLTTEDIKQEVMSLIDEVEFGEPLDKKSALLIGLAVRASVTSLDLEACDSFIEDALRAGVTGAQIQEVLGLVSGLGVHTLMEVSRRLVNHMRKHGDETLDAPLNESQAALWAKYVGDNLYWSHMENEVPGFLDALLRLSPETFEAFFAYCAVPWKSSELRAVTKELISIAVDASTTHRYMPGLRLHLRNAIKLGAGKNAILQTLDIASAALHHLGVC